MIPSRLRRKAGVLGLGLLVAAFASQALAVDIHGYPLRRIVRPIDNADRRTLSGQVHRLARPEFDRGAVGGDYPMQRMVLLLQPTAQQEDALQHLLVALHDPHSPQFHQWLTPDEFGREFGADEQDIATIRGWLTAQGFTVAGVGRSRRSIEFSGTAALIRSAFHTEIHEFEVNGEVHIANATDPQIPAALAPVIRGFVSLHNFRRKPMHVVKPDAPAPAPQMTTSTGKHLLTPYDFATIYNVLPLWNQGIDGTGQTIAVLARSDVYLSDIYNFRSYFLGSGVGVVRQIETGAATPGTSNAEDEVETSADAEWAGAVAKGAAVDIVISASTNTADGIDLSAIYAVDNNLAPIISLSYGACETAMQGDKLYQQLWQQAAAQGISVVVSTGDNGSAGCDDPSKNTLAAGGLAVNGLASTPDNLAVGGTTLNEGGSDATYWNATNDSHNSSAISYIPETTWNDSYNTTTGVSILAGSGGVSSVYGSPVWQTGSGVPTGDPNNGSQHHRYLPDVSLSAAGHDPYFVCAESACSSSKGSPSGYAVYGTSLSAPAFAGLMALVNQQTNSIQGNPNFHLYPLARVSGIFHDVTSGTNEVPCKAGSPGCGSNGEMTGYDSGAGYDLATGWGSVDANALVTRWSSVQFQPTSLTAAASTTAFQHGTAVQFTANVSAGGGAPSGMVNAHVVSSSGTVLELGAVPIVNGAASLSSNAIPGGLQTLYFRYSGDGVYGSSISAGIPLTVSPEPSTTTVTSSSGDTNWLYAKGNVTGESGVGHPTGNVWLLYNGHDVGGGDLSGPDPTGAWSDAMTYTPPTPGTYHFTASYTGDTNFAASSAGFDVTYPKFTPSAAVVCANGSTSAVASTAVQCAAKFNPASPGMTAPTGTVQFYDSGNPLGSALPVGSASLTLSNLAVGSHAISATYSGDANYAAATATTSLNIVQTGTVALQWNTNATALGVVTGNSFSLTATATAQQAGAPLTGTLNLYDGATKLGPGTTMPNPFGFISSTWTINGTTNALSVGTHVLTAKYEGDSSWPVTMSTPITVTVSAGPDFYIAPINPWTMKPGMTSTYTFYIASVGGLSGPVTGICTGAPAEATCTIGANATIGGVLPITIATSAPHLARAVSPFAPWSTLAFAVGFVFLPFGSGRRKAAKYAVLLLAVACILGMLACGGGSTATSTAPGSPSNGGGTTDPGTPAGNYSLQVTVTYGSGTTAITHTYPLSLTVQ